MSRANREVREHDALPQLIARLVADPVCYDHPVTQIRLIETHISWVILTGEYAYKIKKPVDLGFLDFSSLTSRRKACEDEVRLNRRLAPDHYTGVIAITGDAAHPQLGGDGTAIEYAVKMKQFGSGLTLDHLALQGRLQSDHIDTVAARLSRFHMKECAIAPRGSRWGTPDEIARPVLENFLVLDSSLSNPTHKQQLDNLRNWSERELVRLTPLTQRRKRNGMIRECHGDLHLGNLAWTNNAPLIFDCIEFSDALRWIDVISEVAFLFMDLLHRNLYGHAMRFLNAWLEASRDYEGVGLLRYYTVYRALVRAKVAALRLKQTGNAGESLAEVTTCLNLAERMVQRMPTQLWITHGLSGSGKTTVSQRMLQQYGMIRIRSDVERKWLYGYKPMQRTHADIGSGIYTAAADKRTYRHLTQLAGKVLKTGWPVIVDATFLQRWQRIQMRETARRHACPFGIFDIQARPETLQKRVLARAQQGDDASEAGLAVLQDQIETACPLAKDELAISTRVMNG